MKSERKLGFEERPSTMGTDTKDIDNGLIDLTNSMLDQLHVANHVSRVDEISAAVFVLLYEGLCGEQLPDVIRQPQRYEDEVHNCQVVIDALSMDVLHTSLSHITGEEVAMCDRNAIANLLEIFSGLMEYILNKIESDISDVDGDREAEYEDDPDAITRELIDDILDRELGQSRLAQQREVEKRAHMREIVGEQKERSPERQSSQNNQSIPAPAIWEQSGSNKPERLGGGRSSRSNFPHDSRRVMDSQQTGDRLAHKTVPQRQPVSDDHGKSSVLETTESLIREGERVEQELDTRPTRERAAPALHVDTRPTRERAAPALHVDTRPTRERAPVSVLSDLYTRPTVDTTPEISPPKNLGSDGGIFDHVGMRPYPTSALTNERPGDKGSEGPMAGAISAAEAVARSGISHSDQIDGSRGYITRPSRSTLPSELSSSMPAAPVSSRGAPMGAGLRSTVPSHHSSTYQDFRAPASTAVPSTLENKSTSYENLTAFVEETVKLSRDAVSPDRGTASTAKNKLLSKAIRERLVRIENESDEITHLAASLNLPQRRREVEQGRPLSKSLGPSSVSTKSPAKSHRKVSFVTETSSDGDVTDRQRPTSASTKSGADSPVKSTLRKYYEDRSRRNDPSTRRGVSGQSVSRRPSRVTHKPPVPRRRRPVEKGYGSDGDVETLSDQLSDSDDATGARYPYSRRYDALLLEDLEDDQVTRRNVYKEADRRVRFDDLLDKREAAAVNDTRKHIQSEDLKARKKAEFLRELYEHDLDDFKEELEEQSVKDRKAAKQTDKEYKKKVLTGPKTKTKGVKRSTGALATKPRCRAGVARPKTRRRSASASPTVGRSASPLSVGEQDDLFSMMYEEFPYLHLSTETWHELWRQGIQQIERLTKAQQEVKTKKSRAQSQLEEAERRQQILMNIMKKELAHTQRMREVKSRRDQQVSVKNKLHERRMQSARSRKYYDEYQVRSRSKMLKRRTKEEMIFKKLFRDGLDIQKERIKELRRYTKEQREIQTKERQNEIDSMENYYRDQFDMLAESLAREREDQVTREKAQAKVLEQMKKELRKKMEREIEDFQDQLFRDDDDTYFRQLDADRLKHELHMANYHVKV